MAKRIILKENDQSLGSNPPIGYKFLGFNNDGNLVERDGATVSNIGGGGSNYESVTHAQLTTLISTNGLTEGKFYLISDYKTIYVQPDFSDIDTAVIVSASLIKEGVTEPLVVFATSTNTIGSQAWSTTFPDDVIYYVPDVETLFTGYDTKGKIVRRIDKSGNDISFDFRNVKFKKYPSLSFDGYDSYDNGNTPAEHYVFTPWNLQLDSYQTFIKNNKISYTYDSDYDNYTNGISGYDIWGVNIVIYIGTSAFDNEISGFIPNMDIAADAEMIGNKIKGRIRSLYLQGAVLDSNIINCGNTWKAIINGATVVNNIIIGNLYQFTLITNELTNNHMEISTGDVYINSSIFSSNSILCRSFTQLSIIGNCYNNDIKSTYFGGLISGTKSSISGNFIGNEINSQFSSFTFTSLNYNKFNGGALFNNNTGFAFSNNVIEENIINSTFNNGGTMSVQRNRFSTVINGLNLSTASHIYNGYQCDIIYNSSETARLAYLDSGDNWVFTTVNS